MAALDSIVFDVARAGVLRAQLFTDAVSQRNGINGNQNEAPPVTNVHVVTAKADTPPNGVREPGVPQFVQALMNVIPAAVGSASGRCRSASHWRHRRQELYSGTAWWAEIGAADIGSTAFSCLRMTGLALESCEFPAFPVFARGPPVRPPIIWHKRCMVK